MLEAPVFEAAVQGYLMAVSLILAIGAQNAFVLRQDFGERAAGPAAARELGIHSGKTGGKAGAGGARELAAAPDTGMLIEFSREAGHGISKTVCLYSIRKIGWFV